MTSISDVAAHIFSGTIPPGGVAAQVLVKVLPAVFELIANEADPIEIRPHGEALIFFLHFLIPGVLLSERLVVQCQSQHDVGADLSGVKRAVESPELHRAVAMEETVQVQKVVSAAVVVLIAAFPITLVPDGFDLVEGGGLGLVHPFHQISVHLLAVTHSLRLNLQCLIEQVVVAGNDVDEVTDASRGVVGAVQVDMDAAGCVGEAARFAEDPHQALQRVDVLPVK